MYDLDPPPAIAFMMDADFRSSTLESVVVVASAYLDDVGNDRAMVDAVSVTGEVGGAVE